jgi:hypothetical protein
MILDKISVDSRCVEEIGIRRAALERMHNIRGHERGGVLRPEAGYLVGHIDAAGRSGEQVELELEL